MVWTVTIDGLESVAATTSYDVPYVNQFDGDDSDSDGGAVVDIIGANFGPTTPSYLQRVTYGASGTQYIARNCSVVEPHFRIRCVTAPGVGDGLRWLVTVAGQTSRLSVATTSYKAPAVLAFNTQGVPMLTTGGYAVELAVTDVGMGQVGVQCSLDVLSNGGETAVRLSASYAARGFNSTATADTLRFVLPAMVGLGVGFRVAVTDAVSGRETRSPVLVRDFASPTIGKVVSIMRFDLGGAACQNFSAAGVAAGLYSVGLFGANFGPAAAAGAGGAGAGGGAGPALAPGVDVSVWVLPSDGPPQRVTCFETWSDSEVQFLAATPGSTVVNVSFVGYDGNTRVWSSNVVGFDIHSPQVNSLSMDGECGGGEWLMCAMVCMCVQMSV